MKEYFKNKGHLLLAVVVLLVYLSPNIFFQEEAKLLIRDNLDANVTWFKGIAGSDVLFGKNSDNVDWIKNGIPRGLFISEFNVIVGLYYFLPALQAYHLNIVFQTLIAFLGFFLFASRYVFVDKGNNYLIVLISLIYALLPFWPSGGIGLSGMPFLMYVFFNIYYEKEQRWEWIFLCFFPFYSNLFFSGLFTIMAFFVYFLYKQIVSRKISLRLLTAFVLITLSYMLVEYRMLQMVLVEGYDTGRELSQVRNEDYINFKGLIGLSFNDFYKGYYHYHKMIFPLVFFTVLIAIPFFKNIRKKLLLGLAVAFLLSLLPKIVLWEPANFLLNIGVFRKVQFRWYVLVPFLWYWLFAVVIYNFFLKYKQYAKYGVFILSLQLFFVMFSIGDNNFYGNEFAENSFYRTYFDRENTEAKTFRAYYQYDDFKEIKQIVPEGAKVTCLKIHPSVAHFHGYKTFGGYYSLNSTNYMELFKKVQKVDTLTFYNKCYLQAEDNIVDWNFGLLKELGYEYLFSAFPVDNAQNLAFQKVVNNSVYIYKIIEA